MSKNTCTIKGCTKARRAYGLCNMHDLRQKRNGSTESVKRVYSYRGQLCEVEACNQVAIAKAVCKTHYERRRKGMPDHLEAHTEVSICGESKCQAQVKSKGLCKKHYQKVKRQEYINRDPWRYRAYSHQRRMRVIAATVWEVTPQQIALRMQAQENKCWLCGKTAQTIDHVKPLSKGGLHVLANMRPACLSCNSRKRNRWFGTHRLKKLLKD